MKDLKKLNNNELNAELDRFNKIIQKYQKPIDEYDNLLNEFQSNSKSLIKTYSKFYNFFKKLKFDEISKDQTILGFKYGEQKQMDLNCSTTMMNEISNLNKECSIYIDAILKNPLITTTLTILHNTTNGSRYIMGISEGHYIENSQDLKNALNMDQELYLHTYNVNKGRDFLENLSKNNNYSEYSYVLTKEGARFVYNKQMELFLRRKRQIELILRGRNKDKEKTENIGYVYVLSNKSFPPNTFKIGSTYGTPEERAEELTGTGHLHSFKVEMNIKIQSAEYYEKKIHSLLKTYRVKQNREFFDIELSKIKHCLKQVSQISEKGSKKLTLDQIKKEISL